MLSSLRLPLLVALALLVLGRTTTASSPTTAAAATAACRTRCSAHDDWCRETKAKLLRDCTERATCDQPACQRDYTCSFGCAVCQNQVKYQLAECATQRLACETECAV